MRNEEIKYALSTDYERLEQLLRAGVQVIGFVEIIKGGSFTGHSELCIFKYNKKYKSYELWALIHESLMTDAGLSFADICKRYNIRYIPPKP